MNKTLTLRLIVLLMLSHFLGIESATAQTIVPSRDCANAPVMNLPDTVLPYCSAITDGMIYQGEYQLDSISGFYATCNATYSKTNIWYKLTIPANKGIKGFLLNIPLQTPCSTCIDQPFIATIYKGNDCNNLQQKISQPLLACESSGAGSTGYYYQLPIHVDSVNDNETYYINLKADSIASNKTINPGIKWLPGPIQNNECSKSQFINKSVTETCNRIIPQAYSPAMPNYFSNCSAANPIAGQNVVVYSFVTTNGASTFIIKAFNCLGDLPIINAAVYKSCAGMGNPDSLLGCVSNINSGLSDSVRLAMIDLPIGDTLKLVIDIQHNKPGDFFLTVPGSCNLRIISEGILLLAEKTLFSGGFNGMQKRVTLTWNSANNNAFKIYEIERSADGIHFSRIGFVTANQTKTYHFDDYAYVQGISFYRLKELKSDGTSIYSDVLQIRTEIEPGILLFPNPVSDQLTLQYFSSKVQKRTISITDLAGRVILKKTVSLTEMNSSISLNVSQLSKGIYLLIEQGEKTKVFKFIKK